jgi:hypothetical protein
VGEWLIAASDFGSFVEAQYIYPNPSRMRHRAAH